MSVLKRVLLLGAALCLGGCASSIAYRADFVPDKPVADGERISGRVLVYTTRTDDDRLVTAGATSFTGGGAKLTTPIGIMTREIAVKVFSQVATEGANASSDLADASRYTVVVRPQTQDFKYGFPQLKNLGFAITPEVQVQLRVSVLDAAGTTRMEKDFNSGVVEGKSYMMSGSPYERINRLLHETLYDLMRRAADEVRISQGGR